MITQIHAVIGATGASGRAVIEELKRRNYPHRAIRRSASTDSDISTVQANMLIREEAIRAIAGATYVYMCAAVDYHHKIWQKNWPLMMENVIAACLQADAVLVFLDNIYMYGPAPLQIPFDENHPQQPPSKKGLVRKQVADMVLDAVVTKNLKAVIARSADFYGPFAKNSMIYISTLERMLTGKSPQSIAKPGVKHTYGNTVDNARAMVLLATDATAYGQVFHLPVGPAVTPEELIQLINESLGTHYKVSFLPPFMRRLLAWMIPALKETEEMMYQFNHDYIMSFSKFMTQYPDFKVTSYEDGLKSTIASFREQPG